MRGGDLQCGVALDDKGDRRFFYEALATITIKREYFFYEVFTPMNTTKNVPLVQFIDRTNNAIKSIMPSTNGNDLGLVH